MTRNQFLTTVALVVVASATLGSTKANAQSFGISWYTIDGGAATQRVAPLSSMGRLDNTMRERS